MLGKLITQAVKAALAQLIVAGASAAATAAASKLTKKKDR